MVSSKKLANTVGGKTSRACHSCIRKRARWFCAADDAFLCQDCDVSVHSANAMARRHQRVRLKTSSFKSTLENFSPTWHRGFTKKARTPRPGKQSIHPKRKSDEPLNSHLLVPELGCGETSNEEDEEQLLYRVPIFDPLVAELRTSVNSNEGAATVGSESWKAVVAELDRGASSLSGFLPSEMELAEFAADVESLLGKSLNEEPFDMEAMGLLGCKEMECSLMKGSLCCAKVKVEDDKEEEGEDMNSVVAEHVNIMKRSEPFELDFDYDSNCHEEEHKFGAEGGGTVLEDSENGKMGIMKNSKKKKMKLLSLDYEAVIAAWSNRRVPWTNGRRPELDPTDCWPHCTCNCGTVGRQAHGEIGVIGGNNVGMRDGGREARVTRYKEKRRTRLFSKKIRYEVRKLNAEKRPRMKGRFVKRVNISGPDAFLA